MKHWSFFSEISNFFFSSYIVVSSVGDNLESGSLKSSPEKGKRILVAHLVTVSFGGVELGKCVVTEYIK